MNYVSTRGASAPVSSAEAVLQGLAPDGGLYLPESLPDFDWKQCLSGDTLSMAAMLLEAFLPDIPDMPDLVRAAYAGKFNRETLAPTVPVGDFTVLELFHGPTAAFKDVALSMLPRLMTAARRACGKTGEILILTATSGDTGKAALEGFRDVPGIRICVFYPDGGVSGIQRAQMVTQEGNNVHVCAVKGNFDDAQTGVKEIFAAVEAGDLLREKSFRLSSANSINIGRLVPQITYYFRAYRDLCDRGVIRLGDPVNFSVPTGNFGDILAGWLAARLGLPVGKLICASNANRVLTDFLETGLYDRRRELLKTDSPSMDILVSSNLERLLYLMSGSSSLTAGLMGRLSRDGFYQIPEDLHRQIRAQFHGETCDDAMAAEIIGRVWRDHGYLCDTHTAAGWAAAERYVEKTGDHRPMVVLSTASPFKFPTAVLRAVGEEPRGDDFARMEQLAALSGLEIPRGLAGLPGKPERHTGCIEKDQMLSLVLGM